MKIWHSHGSEHSMNLVMIGQFTNVTDAKETQNLIHSLQEELSTLVEAGETTEYSDEVSEVLRKHNIYSLSPSELEHFIYEDTVSKVEDNKIIITTDESEISAFIKLMVQKGAKVEVYSAHDYPDEKYVRGK